MGGFMSALKSKESASVVLDFEHAEPTEDERTTHTRMAQMLEGAEGVLASLRSYEGCQAHVQRAISAPSDENLAAAWDALLPCVAKLRAFWEYALALEAAFPELLGALCGVGKPVAAKLASQQALAKQLGALLDFVIRFDHIKMNTPSIQNDFSYYRRSMTRMKRDAPGGAAEGVLTDEVANRMSLFYASHTPVMTALVGATTSYVHGNRDDGLQLESVCSALSVMAHSCRDMLKNHQFESATTNLFCLRAMVASIILYDQLDAVGAFHRKSPINIRGCVQVLREWPDAGERLSLANMLRFTTRHLRDESTPAGVVELLNDAAAESGPD